MRLMKISLTAMIVSTICVSALFMHALYTPTRLGIGDWTTTVTAANDWTNGDEGTAASTDFARYACKKSDQLVLGSASWATTINR